MERLVWRQVAIPKGLSSILELICKETIRNDPPCIYSFIAELLEKEYEEQIGISEDLGNFILIMGCFLSLFRTGVARFWRPRSQPRKPNEVESEETHLLGKNDNQENVSPVTPVSSLEYSEERSVVNSPSEIPANEVSITPTKSAEAEQVKSPENVEEQQNKPSTPISPPVTTITEQDSSQQEENEIEKLLERSLDTKEIQDLLESGDFQNVSVAEENEESEGDDEEEEEEEEEEYEDEPPLVVIDTKKVVEIEEEDDFEEEEEEDEEEEEQEEREEQEEESDEEEKIRRNLEALMTEDVEASKSDSELNDAAIKIQAGFRGYQTRKNLRKSVKEESDDETPQVTQIGSAPTPSSPIRSAFADESLEEDDMVPIPTPRRRPGSERIRNSAKYRSGIIMNNTSADVDEMLGYDQDYLNKAATRIQANVRGWMTRKDLEKRHAVTNDKKRAATKIQATVRGFLARRRLAKAKMANRRRSSSGIQLKQRRKSSLKLDQAATRIQAAFRGYNVRKGKKSIKRSEKEKSTPASPSTTTMTPPPLETAPTPTDISTPSIPTSLPQDDE
ncbi:unnamed protein product [Allacma fusca]|uniref:Uncharacterized protein n=1 Tax=Allacma fusca TaxID=39272 RepID=A0A8J2PPS5_9HEXA|nr:unnamed protein product [Allacma fusca]